MARKVVSSDSRTEGEHGLGKPENSTSLAQLRSAVESISGFVENINREGETQSSLDEAIC